MADWNPEANDIFLEALGLPVSEQRRTYLDRACGDNIGLRAQVEALLSSSERAGSFLNRPAVDQVLCAAFSSDSKRIVSGGLDDKVHVWDATTSKDLRQYDGHTSAVTSVTFFPDGKRIASASQDGTARIWRAPR